MARHAKAAFVRAGMSRERMQPASTNWARSNRSAAANGIVQQLNALAASDPEYARGIAWVFVENALNWLISHGEEHSQVAERLQQLADTLMVAKRIAGQVAG